MNNYYIVCKAIIKTFHLLFRQDCRVYGARNPPLGAKIIAGNHPNATDGLFLPFIFTEHLHFFAQGDLFDIFFVGWMLAKSEQIPVHPGQKQQAMDQATHYLHEDKVVAIFPEARLNPDGQPQKSYTGAIRLALETKAPIIPVGFYVPPKNLHHIKRMKQGQVSQGHWQTHGHCYLHIGSPWLLSEEIGESFEHADLRGLTEQLMEKINDLAQLAMREYAIETGLPIDLASFNAS
jgi:1-acyl-sn-glycerol-3-phosphate acyltransferase